ncbi:MAG: aldo/keto reductase, partial [Planctomycetes bacterium]|nr:aldo/keto reductase [Planctomycetota bacterium]
ELVISSKVFFPMSDEINDRGLSRKHIFESIEKSLKRIGTDYLDLYFCHRFDEDTPLEETARAMDDLVHQGKILYWGTSEWSGRQLRQVYELCNNINTYRPQVEQAQYSLLARGKFENSARPAALELGMGMVCWSPLCMGILTGKYDSSLPKGSRMETEEWLREERYNDESLERVRKFKAIADEVECSRAQLALAWVAAQEGVSSVILGANRLEQLRENLGALAIEITPELDQEMQGLFPIPQTV